MVDVGQAVVGECDMACAGDKDVVVFDVAVHDSDFVKVVNGKNLCARRRAVSRS